jgi:hypothetical protein
LMVSDSLPVQVLLGTGWIEKHVRMILPNQGALELSTGSVVSLIRRDLGKLSYVRCARDMVVPPLTEVSLAVKSDWRDLGVAVSSKRRGKGYLANGMAEFSGRVMYMRYTNFNSEPLNVRRGSVLGTVRCPPEVFKVTEDGDVNEDDWGDSIEADHLTPSQQGELKKTLDGFQNLWKKGRLGEVKGVYHRIDTGSATPVHAQPYRAGPAARQAERAEAEKLLKEGVIEPSDAEWSSPVVLIPKTDGSLRFCVDYRAML